MAKASKSTAQPEGAKPAKVRSADKKKAPKDAPTEPNGLDTVDEVISHRTEARRMKKAKGPQAARVPPAELMDLVYNFLNDYNYVAAVNSIRSHHNKRPGHNYQQFVKMAGKGGYPDLSTIFDEWKTKSYIEPKQEVVTVAKPKAIAKTEAIASDASSSDSSSDSDSGAESEAEADSDVDMADDSSATLGRSDAEPAGASDSSDESSADSSSDSEVEDVPAIKPTKTKKPPVSTRATSPTSSSSSSSDSSSDSSSGSASEEADSDSSSESDADSEDAAGVPLPKSDDSSSDDSSSDDESDDAEAVSKRLIPEPAVANKKRKVGSDERAAPSPADSKRIKKEVKPFSRIPDDVKVDPRLASNAYVSYGYADEAHNKLIITKGKDFTKAKNKGKRGSYRGGMIDIDGARGIKFDD